MANTTKKRRLGDLFVKGENVTLTDKDGSLTVWVQKLNPTENDTALKKANAVRARYLTRQATESEDYLSLTSEIEDMRIEDIIEFLVAEDIAGKANAAEAQIAEDNGWNKDGYLQGLLDAWHGEDGEPGLIEAHARGEEDEQYADAERVFREMERYEKEVSSEIEKLREDSRHAFRARDESELKRLMTDKMFRLQGDLSWTLEYRKQQLLLGVRDEDNHKSRYFESREEVDELPEEVTRALIAAYTRLDVGGEEGKDLLESRSSLPPSDSLEIPEMVAS